MSEKKHAVDYVGDAVPAIAVKKEYDTLLQKMATDFDVAINLVTCHGKSDVVPELDFEKFYIFAMLAPDGLAVRKTKMKKLHLGSGDFDVTGGQQDILALEGELPKGSTLIKDTNGKDLAIVYDAAVYFLSDFIHCNSKAELDVSIKTFKHVMDIALETSELIKSLKSGYEEKGRRALQAALIKQFSDRLKKEEIQMESSEKLIDEYLINLTKAQRKIISTKKIIEAIHENISDIPTALERKWESTKKLSGSRMYESVSFQRSGVKGVTMPIFIEHSGKLFKLGKFEVNLGFDGRIKIFSLFKERGPSQDHPHITGGNPCWGNMSGELPKRIAESEFDVALVEIHTFLCHYSREGGPYSQIANWPEASREEKEAWKEHVKAQ